MKKSLLLLFSICGLSLLNGCGGVIGPPPPPIIPATHFSVTPATATPTSGTAFMITVTALGASGQTATSYNGTVHFASSDPNAILPADTAMTSVTGTFPITLNTVGSQTVTVTGTGSVQGISNAIAVAAVVAPTHFSVVSATYLVTAGTPINVTVTAADASGNTVTSYSGTVHFTSNDSKAVLPANSPLVNGVGTFSATLNTSGNQTILATDTSNASINGSTGPLPVSGPATHFSITSAISVATRASILVGVNPLDASNNFSSGYNGTVHLTSSDRNAILPANGGSGGSFQVTFETAGNQTITATDVATPSITGTSSNIAVTESSAPAITSGAPPNGTVGSTYGPTFIQYLRCTSFPLQPSCTPCVPNTPAGCGASLPFCARQRYAPVCVGSDKFVGFSLTAAGGLLPYTWSASSLPTGLSLKSQTPETLISGVPSPGTAATYNGSVTVTDSGSPKVTSPPIPYTIIISNPPLPVVSTTPLLPGATLNQPFSYTFTATAGLPPYQNWMEKGGLPAGILPLTTAGVLSGTPTMAGPFLISVTTEDSLGQISASQDFNLQVYQHGFKSAGAMGTARTSHTATLLADGTVLLAGGLGLSSAEKYDPVTGKFTATAGSMSVARIGFTATLLKDGKVLITGGQASWGTAPYPTAELFDPSTGMFTATAGSMTVARIDHTATLLASGKVLITGGFNGSTCVAASELFDPGTGSFTSTGALGTARSSHTATLLNSGKVLVTGGFNNAALATAELFDPGTGSFSSTGAMAAARVSHTATLLNTGQNADKVLIAGGSNLATAEVYDPTIGSFSSTGPMTTPGSGTAALLGDGTVLLAGGADNASHILAAAELFEPNSGTFTGTGGLLTPRIAHTETLLKDGTVLVTGGVGANSGILALAELYQ
jgi:hypothetical protein